MRIYIISGFLGAGKTTMILKLIHEVMQDKKVCVIENEFGSINFDGQKLKRNGFAVKELQSGCICCTLVQDLKTTIDKVIAEEAPDYIILEPSGASDLPAVQRALKIAVGADAEICSITVADAQVCADFIEDFGDFYRNQLLHADIVVLSHVLECTQDEREQAMDAMETIDIRCPVICADWSEVSAQEMLSMVSTHNKNAGIVPDGRKLPKLLPVRHLMSAQLEGEQFSMMTLTEVAVCSQEILKNKLQSLMDDERYGEVFRIKGVLRVQDGKVVQFDCIRDRQYFEDISDGVEGINVIGKRLEKEAIKKLF